MITLYYILLFAAGFLTAFFLSSKKETKSEGIKQSDKIKLISMYENDDTCHTLFYYEITTDKGLEPKRIVVVEGMNSAAPVSCSQLKD